MDTANDDVRQYDPTTGNLNTLAGTSGSGFFDGPAREATFADPNDVLALGGELFIADKDNNAIRLVIPGDTGFNVITLAGNQDGADGKDDGLGTDARFYGPVGLSKGPEGSVIVADYANFAVRQLAPDGTVTTLVDDAGVLVTSAAVDAQGRIYVATPGDHNIQILVPTARF